MKLKKIFYWLVTIVILYLLFRNLNDFYKLQELILHEAKYRWLFLAVISSLVSFTAIFLAHQKSLELFGIRRKFSEIVILTLKSLAVNMSAPTIGNIGSVVFYNDAGREKSESKLAAALSTFVVIISEIVSFSFVLLFSVLYLNDYQHVSPITMTALTIFSVVVVIAIALPVIFWINKRYIRKIVDSCIKFINYFLRLFKRKEIQKSAVRDLSTEIEEIIRSVENKPKYILQVLLFEFINHLANIICVYMIFLAFTTGPKIAVATAAYAMAVLFKIASPTPEGIGFTEGSMALTISSFGVSSAAGAAVALVFRSLSFWLPLLAGVTILHREKQPEKR